MEKQTIIDTITAAFGDADISLDGEDCSFQITVISDAFAKQTAVKRQQSILALFNDALRSGELHALTIKAYTPQEHASFTPPGLTQITL